MEYLRHKLWVSGFACGLSNHDLQQFCERFGQFVHMYRTKGKTDVFLTYQSEDHAEAALQRFRDENISANFAYDKSGQKEPGDSDRRVHFSNGHGSGVGSSRSQQKVAVFRTGEEVIITNVRKDFFFNAYPKAKDHEYKQLLEAISQSATNAERLKDLPRKGNLVLASCDGDYCRALVLNDVATSNHLVHVSILDFGFTAQLPFDELKILPEKFHNTRIIYRFQMDHYPDDAKNSYALECFKTFVGSTLKMENVDCDDATIKPLSKVKLIEPDTKECVNKLIHNMTLTFTIYEQTKRPIPIGTNKELTVVDLTKLKDGYNLITFVEQSMNLEYYRQRNQTQTIAKIIEKFPPYLPNEEELCFVNYNDYWYRASFIEKIGEAAVVLLIDIQKGVQVELKNIRKITKDFAQDPVLTFTAALDGYNKNISKEKAIALMHKFKLGDDLCVKSIREDYPEIKGSSISIQI